MKVKENFRLKNNKLLSKITFKKLMRSQIPLIKLKVFLLRISLDLILKAIYNM